MAGAVPGRRIGRRRPESEIAETRQQRHPRGRIRGRSARGPSQEARPAGPVDIGQQRERVTAAHDVAFATALGEKRAHRGAQAARHEFLVAAADPPPFPREQPVKDLPLLDRHRHVEQLIELRLRARGRRVGPCGAGPARLLQPCRDPVRQRRRRAAGIGPPSRQPDEQRHIGARRQGGGGRRGGAEEQDRAPASTTSTEAGSNRDELEAFGGEHQLLHRDVAAALGRRGSGRSTSSGAR